MSQKDKARIKDLSTRLNNKETAMKQHVKVLDDYREDIKKKEFHINKIEKENFELRKKLRFLSEAVHGKPLDYKHVEKVICDIMINDGPDRHTDGADIITKYVKALIQGKELLFEGAYFDSQKKERHYTEA